MPVLGDQLLLGIMLFGVPGKKGAALLGTLLLHLLQSRRDLIIETVSYTHLTLPTKA